MWKVVNAHKMSVQMRYRKRTSGKEKCKEVTIVPKWILKNWGLEAANSAGSGNIAGVGCFENSCLIKGGELLDQLNYYQLSKKDSAPHNLTLHYLGTTMVFVGCNVLH